LNATEYSPQDTRHVRPRRNDHRRAEALVRVDARHLSEQPNTKAEKEDEEEERDRRA
jgi:hypothetical protein